jgi:hypothetical protein
LRQNFCIDAKWHSAENDMPFRPADTTTLRVIKARSAGSGGRAFVKFFGQATNRSSRDRPVLDTVKTSGSHRICTYPRGRRPRAVREGDVMFMGHLVSGPNDIVVYGRGITRAYEEGRDDALPEDVARRPWLARWSHFIRVHDVEFVDGVLGNGVSLGELMDEVGPYAFGPTAENADRGIGNVDPRKSIRQAAAIRLSEAGVSWLNEEPASAFGDHGKLPPAQLAEVD